VVWTYSQEHTHTNREILLDTSSDKWLTTVRTHPLHHDKNFTTRWDECRILKKGKTIRTSIMKLLMKTAYADGQIYLTCGIRIW